MKPFHRLLNSLRYGTIAAAAVVIGATQASAEFPRFEVVELDPHIGDVCYAVTVADVDGDGDDDAVAISENRAIWYRNPDWKAFVMIEDAVPRDHVCIAPADIDGDGAVDFAIGAGWPQNGGTLHWIRRGETLDDPWQVHNIGAEPWTHRMRFADVLGRGREQLVVSPLNATSGPGVRLLAFPIPDDPTSGDWRPVVMDASMNRMHNHWQLAAEDGGRSQTLTASQEGITRLAPVEGGGFERIAIASGASGEDPNSRGAGEVKNGQLAPDRPLLATIEPMHGNQVVVYLTDDAREPTTGERVVLDDSFNQGHAVALADLDGDGADEVVAAYRQASDGRAPGIFLYRADDATGKSWTRQPLDIEKMACEDLVCHDFDGDGRVDILAGGRATQNVRLYLNRGTGGAGE